MDEIKAPHPQQVVWDGGSRRIRRDGDELVLEEYVGWVYWYGMTHERWRELDRGKTLNVTIYNEAV